LFILSEQLTTEDAGATFSLEDSSVRLNFQGESAILCRNVMPLLSRCHRLEELADFSNYSPTTLSNFLSILEDDNLLLDLSDVGKLRTKALVVKIRSAATFWNKHIMGQAFPIRLFQGKATRAEVLGWGIEFYFFIRAANEYMARGCSRVDGPTSALSGLWEHYAEEALHDEIFLKGLIDCGLSERDIIARPPLASTLALLHHLYETSEQGLLEYAALFAVMQPLSQSPTVGEISSRYGFLRSQYPFAAGLFDAFERHDGIDASLGHSKLALEPILQSRGKLDAQTIYRLFSVIEHTAKSFVFFFSGIPQFYTTARSVTYRQVPNALRASSP
jgi:pyrroloquinoline quinone (PQQ) biosynthesis protein C